MLSNVDCKITKKTSDKTIFIELFHIPAMKVSLW